MCPTNRGICKGAKAQRRIEGVTLKTSEKRKSALASLALLMASGGLTHPAQASEPDLRAIDAAQFFAAFCFVPMGKSDSAKRILGGGNAFARPLPADILRQIQGGREGGEAWTIRSPRNAELLLHYDPNGLCVVRIREADPESVRVEVEKMASSLAKGAKTTAKKTEDASSSIEGVNSRYQAYQMPVATMQIQISLTTTDKPVSGQQHVVTFGILPRTGT